MSQKSKLVLIGASTGGPGQIQKIVASLPKLENTIVIIAQHMANDFIPSFMKRLQENSLNHLDIAKDMQMVKNGFIYMSWTNCCQKRWF